MGKPRELVGFLRGLLTNSQQCSSVSVVTPQPVWVSYLQSPILILISLGGGWPTQRKQRSHICCCIWSSHLHIKMNWKIFLTIREAPDRMQWTRTMTTMKANKWTNNKLRVHKKCLKTKNPICPTQTKRKNPRTQENQPESQADSSLRTSHLVRPMQFYWSKYRSR